MVLKRQGSKGSLKKGGLRSRVPSHGNMKGERGLHKSGLEKRAILRLHGNVKRRGSEKVVL